MRYSKEYDWVLDPFLGGGTTLVEAKLLHRNAIGVDVNEASISISENNLKFDFKTEAKMYLRRGDARNLSFIKNDKIDLICMHPPYADIIKYSNNIDDDLSLLPYDEFIAEMHCVAKEAFRILKYGKICAVMIGDIRRRGNVMPLGFSVMNCFLKAGFISKEIIIKEQHNCRSTKEWNDKVKDFIMLSHEYIFIFVK